MHTRMRTLHSPHYARHPLDPAYRVFDRSGLSAAAEGVDPACGSMQDRTGGKVVYDSY